MFSEDGLDLDIRVVGGAQHFGHFADGRLMPGREGLNFHMHDLPILGSFFVLAGNKNIMEIFGLGGNDPAILAKGLIGSDEMGGVALENAYDTPCGFSGFPFRLDTDHHMVFVHGFVHVAGIDVNIVFPIWLVGNNEPEPVRVAV